MKVIIVGCGRVGSELAYRLYQQKNEVTIIDSVPNAFNMLPPDFQGRTIEGDALSRDVLHRAGIERADALAVVTASDALNAVVAHIGRSVYGLNVVVVRNYDPTFRPMQECFDLQHVSAASWAAQRLEEMVCHCDVQTVFSAGNGEVEIYEFVVPMTWNNHALKELSFPDQCIPVSVTHAGKAILPNRDTRLEAGDVLHVSATIDGVEALRQRINHREEA
jgi:trk system potassium uptake protein